MTATVSVENVSVSFHGQKVLSSVSAVFPAGKISVVVGRSGSGKTTLLRTINRLNEEFPGCATTGKVCVDFGQGPCDIYGEEYAGAMGLSNLRLRVGMLFQTPNCFPVSAYRNIALPLKLLTGATDQEAAQRVQESLTSVGLWEELKNRLDIPAERLSGGQQQRLCLARMLALRPGVLLLDEPTASLDVHAAHEIEELLRGLAEKYCVIMVSHALRQARSMADQLLVCERGRITATSTNPGQLSDVQLTQLLPSSQDYQTDTL